MSTIIADFTAIFFPKLVALNKILLYTNYMSEKRGLLLEHYFTNNENLKSNIREIFYQLNNIKFTFLSDNGVFSKNNIDYASKLLVETFIQEHHKLNNEFVLDVGGGYGFIGITICKLTEANVDIVDINKRAIHLCERNIKLNEIPNCRVFASNIYENVKNKYKYIITNPPIRAGKKTVLKILMEAKNHLDENGELWFVINKDQGAKSTKNALEECYNIEIVEKSKGFFVFRAKIS